MRFLCFEEDILFCFHKGVHSTITGVHLPGDDDVPGGLGDGVVLLSHIPDHDDGGVAHGRLSPG